MPIAVAHSSAPTTPSTTQPIPKSFRMRIGHRNADQVDQRQTQAHGGFLEMATASGRRDGWPLPNDRSLFLLGEVFRQSNRLADIAHRILVELINIIVDNEYCAGGLPWARIKDTSREHYFDT